MSSYAALDHGSPASQHLLYFFLKFQLFLHLDKLQHLKDRFSALEIGKLRQGFRKQIRHKVGKAKYYPRMAQRLGFEGKPVVSFTLGVKGELLDLRLAQASTYSLLNEAALETIRRGTPYPPIPGPLGKKSISFDLPILYTLED